MERYIFIKKLRADGMHWGGYELYYTDDGIRSRELVFDGSFSRIYVDYTIREALRLFRDRYGLRYKHINVIKQF